MTIEQASLDKYKLLDGIIHDLSDEQAGLTVRGYRNCNIVRTLTEALTALKQGLKDEDNARAQEIGMLKQQIKDLQRDMDARDSCPDGGTYTEGGHTYTIDLEGGAAHEDHD